MAPVGPFVTIKNRFGMISQTVLGGRILYRLPACALNFSKRGWHLEIQGCSKIPSVRNTPVTR